MKPLLKWPGGKSREIQQIYGLIPEYKRYIEPFFGGGALYFHLQPETALINDTSSDLMCFYSLLREQSPELMEQLHGYALSFRSILELVRSRITAVLAIYDALGADPDAARDGLTRLLDEWMPELLAAFPCPLVLDEAAFREELERSVWDKLVRTRDNDAKRPFSPEDLSENLVTGFASGYYMYFRQVYNDWNMGRNRLSVPAQCANFFFIREYCYGSMFRYNAKGEFNIPYGGMSYNDKDFEAKVRSLEEPELQRLLSGTEIHCRDFEDFLNRIGPEKDDFIFLDPPYDTEFADYEGASFTKLDHARLAVALSRTKAKFLLVIKETPFIADLYSQGFYVQSFDKQYSYNVRSRNDRTAQHLVITNYPVE